jgi:SAM-dependent methyltransferase
VSAEDFWEEFYAGGRSRWSGKPNASLVEEVTGVVPGTALDLGCGQGGDAIWLAAQGWVVTATDISQTALDVAAGNAAEAGVQVAWERHDLAVSQPEGSFDLVTASFLHSEVELPRERILRAAAGSVAPGGTLLVVGHAPSPEHPHHDLPAPEQIVDELALPEDDWELRASELRERLHAFHGEAPKARIDTVVRFRRRRSAAGSWCRGGPTGGPR